MATEQTGAVSTCVDSHGSAVGMPQLCADWFPNQVFWLVIALIAIFLILSRIALPRIAAILAERHGTILSDLTAAEDLKRQAQEAEAAYDKALADAKAEAQRIGAEAKAEIQAEVDVAIQKADAEIAAKSAESEKAIAEIRASAVESIEVVAKEAATEIVAMLGGKADESTVATAVSNRLKG